MNGLWRERLGFIGLKVRFDQSHFRRGYLFVRGTLWRRLANPPISVAHWHRREWRLAEPDEQRSPARELL